MIRFLLVLPFIVHVHRIAAESEDKLEDWFYDPRAELEKTQTSGERASIHAYQQNTKFEVNIDPATSFVETPEALSSSLLPPASVTTQQARSSPKTTMSYNGNNPLLVENEAVSNAFGINRTATHINADVYARLLRSSQNKPPNGSVTVSSSYLDAHYFLGLIHLYGLVPNSEHRRRDDESSRRDLSIAKQYFLTAASSGHNDARCALGLLLYHGNDETRALAWFFKAAQHGHARGRWLLGRAMYNGWSFDVGSNGKGAKTIHNVTRENVPDQEHFRETARWLMLASEDDESVPEAKHLLAVMHEYDLIPPDFHEQDRHYEKSQIITEQRGRRPLLSGGRRKDNFQKALSLYTKAYDLFLRQGSNTNGLGMSSYNIGLMYAYGRGTGQDFTKATEWFRKGAVEHGYGPSMRYLGIFALNGHGFENKVADYKQALRWFQLCARNESGDNRISEKCALDRDQVQTALKKFENKYGSR